MPTTILRERSALRERAFIAEYDDEMSKLLSNALQTNGFDVVEFESKKTLLDALQSGKTNGVQPTLIVSDHRMPHHTGLDVLLAVRK
jgi:DNA-binding response OmpR family regulator